MLFATEPLLFVSEMTKTEREKDRSGWGRGKESEDKEETKHLQHAHPQPSKGLTPSYIESATWYSKKKYSEQHWPFLKLLGAIHTWVNTWLNRDLFPNSKMTNVCKMAVCLHRGITQDCFSFCLSLFPKFYFIYSIPFSFNTRWRKLISNIWKARYFNNHNQIIIFSNDLSCKKNFNMWNKVFLPIFFKKKMLLFRHPELYVVQSSSTDVGKKGFQSNV